MFACVHVCMDVCAYTQRCVYIYVCIHISGSICIYIYTHTYFMFCLCVFTHLCRFVDACLQHLHGACCLSVDSAQYSS